MKKVITFALALIAISLMSSLSASAQLKYQSGRVLIGTDTPFYYYVMSVAGNGIYFNHTNGRFLQISVAATGAPRIAGHNDQIVFYNSQTSTFNSIQVRSTTILMRGPKQASAHSTMDWTSFPNYALSPTIS